MSKQRQSFFALRGSNPDHAQMPPVPSFSLCGGNVFTIDCVFYTEHKDDEDIFIKQDQVFSMGMTNGTVYFEATHLGRIQTMADFGTFISSDKGKYKLPIQMIGACETVNLVSALICDKDACVLPIGTSPVNPGAHELSSYTILATSH